MPILPSGAFMSATELEASARSERNILTAMLRIAASEKDEVRKASFASKISEQKKSVAHWESLQ